MAKYRTQLLNTFSIVILQHTNKNSGLGRLFFEGFVSKPD